AGRAQAAVAADAVAEIRPAEDAAARLGEFDALRQAEAGEAAGAGDLRRAERVGADGVIALVDAARGRAAALRQLRARAVRQAARARGGEAPGRIAHRAVAAVEPVVEATGGLRGDHARAVRQTARAGGPRSAVDGI